MRDIAPSDELRRWYGHEPSRWPEFESRYEAELADAQRGSLVQRLEKQARNGPLTLLCAAKDAEHSNAAVLAKLLDKRLGR
jgi:uncharacterized protein YeaO (DUF488 family)